MTQPLPDDLDLSDIGSKYILVPYALQFPDEDQPLPVGCTVANSQTGSITSHILDPSGEWSELDEITVNPQHILGSTNPENIYKSILGVSSSDWKKFDELLDNISRYVSTNSQIQLDLLEHAGGSSSYPIFCSCSTPDEKTGTLLTTDEITVTLKICTKCRGSISATGTKDGKQQFVVTETDDVHSVSAIEEDMDAKDVESVSDSEFLYTPTSLSRAIGLSSILWWLSQRKNPDKNPYIPFQSNSTFLCRNSGISGLVIWSYHFGVFPTATHLYLPDNDGGMFTQNFDTVYLQQPYSMELDSFENVRFTSSSIEFQSKKR